MSAAHAIGRARREEREVEERAEIARALFYDRLTFQYGPDRAQAIFDGKDEATNADLARWRAMGSNDGPCETRQAFAP